MQLIIQLPVIGQTITSLPLVFDLQRDGGALVKAKIEKSTFYGMTELAYDLWIVTIQRLTKTGHMGL